MKRQPARSDVEALADAQQRIDEWAERRARCDEQLRLWRQRRAYYLDKMSRAARVAKPTIEKVERRRGRDRDAREIDLE